MADDDTTVEVHGDAGAPDEGASLLEGFTLAPSWARQDSGKQDFKKLAERHERDGAPRDRDFRKSGRDLRGREMPRPPRRDTPAGDGGWAPRHDDGRPPRRDDGRPPRSDEGRPPRRDDARGPRRDDGRDYRAPYRAPVDPATFPVEVRFLPESKALSVVIHKVMKSHRALPVRNLAKLFLDNPASCEVRLELKPDQPGKTLLHCKKCGMIALDEAEMKNHVLSAHFDDVFQKEEVEVDPPAGNFVCVARCGVTGKLLAPPNHHSYARRVMEVFRNDCRTLSEEAYRAKIEVVHDAALVEQWKEEARKKT
ncbi:MAG: hypothetical protein FWF84_02215, partial [Kiritimatiellaeota bacterium]|nr:hypothetical protein [Kiritimatiellota bacterium]